ncbi:MAG: hypothetical protein IJX02_06400 [Clostridia bacterium]|nr:hypothetical protein [Clostridia bacterium]
MRNAECGMNNPSVNCVDTSPLTSGGMGGNKPLTYEDAGCEMQNDTEWVFER